jgi:hypothetical protein
VVVCVGTEEVEPVIEVEVGVELEEDDVELTG